MALHNRLFSLALASTIGLLLPMTVFAEQVKLEQGTPIHLKLVDGVSSALNKEGDKILFKVAEDVFAPDEKTVLIKSDTPAWGIITLLQERAMLGQKGEIALTIEGTKAIDGKQVPLRASLNRQGSSKMGISIGLAVFVSWLFIFLRGKDAKIAPGVPVIAYIDRDVLVEAKVMDAPVATAVTSVSAAVLTSEPKIMPNYLQKYVDNGDQTNALKALEQLHEQGVLTQAEFDVKKKALEKK